MGALADELALSPLLGGKAKKDLFGKIERNDLFPFGQKIWRDLPDLFGPSQEREVERHGRRARADTPLIRAREGQPASEEEAAQGLPAGVESPFKDIHQRSPCIPTSSCPNEKEIDRKK